MGAIRYKASSSTRGSVLCCQKCGEPGASSSLQKFDWGAGLKKKVEYAIDALQPSDWQQVRSIYLEGIETGQATFETDAPDWEKWDAGHLKTCRLVARASDVVAGWTALSSVSGRRVYRGVAELSVFVGESFRSF